MPGQMESSTTMRATRRWAAVDSIARAFFARVRVQADQRGLLSDEHFTVDGTLIEAWASLKSFQRKDA